MDEILGIKVPQNMQAEQAVIGSMLIDPSCIPDVLRVSRAGHFYTKTNREIFETINYMFSFGLSIDPVTIMDQMDQRGVLHEDTKKYIAELMRLTPTAANVLSYAEIISDKALQRDLGTTADEIRKMVNDGIGDGNDMLEVAERKIFALRNDRAIGGLKPISEAVNSVYENLSELAENGGGIPGIQTGLVDLDAKLLGLNPGELVLIASRPGMGKTSIALNIAMKVAKDSRKKVAVFSLEMSREELARRLLSSEGKVDNQKLLKGNLNSEEMRNLVDAAGTVAASGILVDDNSTITVADMNAECRRVPDLALVVIDYLQLISAAGGRQVKEESRQQMVADMSRMLKIMAKELRVPVLCLCQLSRANEKRQGDKRPILSDLRDSGAIEQDADSVIALFRENYYDKNQDQTKAEAIILKNRKGETGVVNLMWIPQFTKYENVSYRDPE